MNRTLLGLVIVATGVACTAWGQDQPDQAEGPGRGVARISLMNGDVSVRRGDSGDVVAAAVNAPLVVMDQLLTGPDSRAEVQFDWANMVRLAAHSEVRLAELETQRYQLQVARGMVTFSVLRDSNAQVEISTPSVSVRPVRQGTYRIAVREDGTAEITVRSGEAEIFTPQGSERLTSGRTMLARGTASDPEFQVAQAVAYDEWDRWNENRDRQLEGSRSYNYVSRDVYGAEDLDSYGTWQNDPSYGNVWYPRVADDWAPYRDGRWVWVDWYGWSWVSYDPWGWAPYHYGRWCYNDNLGWGWWPGDRYGRHYWSPGLVAFVGWDSWGGIRAGLGFGGIGWIPLAPHERYYPWYGNRHYSGYRNGGRYGNGITIVNNFNFNSGYRNARVRNAITGVDGQGFVSGRRGSAIGVNDSQLGRASLVRGALPVTPGRESLRLSDRAVRTDSLPQGRNATRFVSRQQPARVDRVPFEDQRRGMEQMTRSTFSGQRSPAVNSVGAAGRNQGTGGVERGAAPGTSQGWRRIGDGAPVGDRNATGIGGSRQPSGTASDQRSPAVNSVGPAGRNQGTGGVERGAAPATSQGWRRLGDGAPVGDRNATGIGGSRQPSGTASDPRSPAVTNSGPGARNQGIGGVERGAAPATSQGWRRLGDGAPVGDRNTTGIGGSRQPSGTAPARSSTGAGNNDWRRFSEPVGGSGQSAIRAPQNRPDGGSLRTPQSGQPNLQGGSASRNSAGSWSRFGTGSGNSSPRAVDRGQNSRSTGSSAAPRYSNPPPRTSSPQVNGSSGRTPLTVNPPIVRQRAPSSGGSGSYSRPAPSYGGGGSYSRSAPSGGGGSYSRPAPSYGGGGSYSRSAPSGGGGSYSRSAPSGGGGSYSRPAPSYGGGGSYSRSAPSGGGGSYSRSAPSGGGGSYSRSAPSGGGGRTSGGGGGGGRGGRTR